MQKTSLSNNIPFNSLIFDTLTLLQICISFRFVNRDDFVKTFVHLLIINSVTIVESVLNYILFNFIEDPELQNKLELLPVDWKYTKKLRKGLHCKLEMYPKLILGEGELFSEEFNVESYRQLKELRNILIHQGSNKRKTLNVFGLKDVSSKKINEQLNFEHGYLSFKMMLSVIKKLFIVFEKNIEKDIRLKELYYRGDSTMEKGEPCIVYEKDGNFKYFPIKNIIDKIERLKKETPKPFRLGIPSESLFKLDIDFHNYIPPTEGTVGILDFIYPILFGEKNRDDFLGFMLFQVAGYQEK